MIPKLCAVCPASLTQGFIETGLCKECVIEKMPTWERAKLPFLTRKGRRDLLREYRDRYTKEHR